MSQQGRTPQEVDSHLDEAEIVALAIALLLIIGMVLGLSGCSAPYSPVICECVAEMEASK